MTTPRTVAGQAALSGKRPHVKRALAQTIASIEAEAIAPYMEALREADRVLESIAADGTSAALDDAWKVDIVRRAEAVHRLVGRLIAAHVHAAET